MPDVTDAKKILEELEESIGKPSNYMDEDYSAGPEIQ